MKKLISLIVLFTLISNTVYADCDFKTGITPGPNKTFIYNEECHQKVGQLVQDNDIKTQQMSDLNKAVQLKDLAIKDSDTRANMWMATSNNQQDRLAKIDSDQKVTNIIYFGLGILLTSLAVYGGAKALGH